MVKSVEQFPDRSPATSEPVESPFLTILPWQRFSIVAVVTAYLIWIGLQELNNPELTASSGSIFLALVLNFALLLVPVIFYQPTFGWFHPLIYGGFMTLTYHLRRLDVYTQGLHWNVGLPGWSVEELNGLVVYELLLRAIALAMILLGFYLSPRFGAPKLTFAQPVHLARKAIFTVLFATGICLVYMQTQGGIASHIMSWGSGRRYSMAGEGYWLYFIQLGMVGSLTWLAIDRKAPQKPMFWLCGITALVISFMASGSRGSLIYFIVMSLMVWLMRERKISITKILAVVMAGLLLMGILGNFRESTYSGGEIHWGALIGASRTEESALSHGVYEVTSRAGVRDAVYSILARVPEDVDYLNGDSYLALLTLPIPRGLWPEKPGLIGGRVGAIFFNISAGIPPGPIGEAYWNFGVPGVVVAYFLFGAFYRWLADAFVHYAYEPIAIILYTVTLFQLSEPSSTGVQAWLMMILLTIALLLIYGALRFKPASSS